MTDETSSSVTDAPTDFYAHPALAPIYHLLTDPTVSEIMVNGPSEVYFQRGDQRSLAEVSFPDDDSVVEAARVLFWEISRAFSAATPTADGRLPNGVRAVAVHGSVARHTMLTLMKPQRPLVTADLIGNGTIPPEAFAFLAAATRGRANILVAGSTGGGKTTLLNALCTQIPSSERVITVEDTRELVFPPGAHVCAMEGRVGRAYDDITVGVRDLVRSAVRMSPDRVVVGEIRDEVALDVLQAMVMGFEGTMATLHATSPEGALQRLRVLAAKHGEIHSSQIGGLVGDALDLLVTIERLPDGRRMVTDISEVRKPERADELPQLRTLWKIGPDHVLMKMSEPSRELRRRRLLDAQLSAGAILAPVLGTPPETTAPQTSPAPRPAAPEPSVSFLPPLTQDPLTSEEARSTTFARSPEGGYHPGQVDAFVQRSAERLATMEAREVRLARALREVSELLAG